MATYHTGQANTIGSFSPLEEDFGAFIERIRRRCRVQINEVAALFPTYLPTWNRFTYSHTIGERKRLPRFEELLPLYQSLVIAGVQFSAAERNRYLALARQRIERASE